MRPKGKYDNISFSSSTINNYLIILSLLILSLLTNSCKHKITIDELNGEWVADSVSYYLSFRNDSLCAANTSLTLHGTDKKSLHYSQSYLKPQLKYFPYKLRNDSLYILQDNKINNLGAISFRDNKLSLIIYNGIEPITFSKLNYNPAIKIDKIQLSKTWPDCSKLLFDIEITDTMLIYHANNYLNGYGFYYIRITGEQYNSVLHTIKSIRFNETMDRYRISSKLTSDAAEYGLFLTVNGQNKKYLFCEYNVPPEFIPVLNGITSIVDSNQLNKLALNYWFESRLILTNSLEDTLKHLNKFDPVNFRVAQYAGGFASLRKDLTLFLSALPDSLFPYCFYLDITREGTVSIADIRDIKSKKTINKLNAALKSTKRWKPAIYKGKAISSRKWILFYDKNNGLING
ncbi:MAG: hypothetical protein P4L45_14320 [Ignavibacteriaceae bacterium]|nr:hypothetical protein [Ignavibacteriaceae bacterium]